MTSDQIAALALIVSIAGFWVAYKSWYQSRKLIVAEKRTQVWHALVEARLVLLNLHFVIREIASIFSALESAGSCGRLASSCAEEVLMRHNALSGLVQTYENEIASLTNTVQVGLDQFKDGAMDDPVVLEESFAIAREMETRARGLFSNTATLKLELEKYSQRYASI